MSAMIRQAAAAAKAELHAVEERDGGPNWGAVDAQVDAVVMAVEDLILSVVRQPGDRAAGVEKLKVVRESLLEAHASLKAIAGEDAAVTARYKRLLGVR